MYNRKNKPKNLNHLRISSKAYNDPMNVTLQWSTNIADVFNDFKTSQIYNKFNIKNWGRHKFL